MKTTKEAFDYYDSENKGFLTAHELKCCIIYLTGTKLSKLAMSRLKEHKSEFTISDLNSILANQIREDPYTEIFNALDQNNKGYLNFEDFDRLCEVYVKHLRPAVRESVFSEIDSNKDGMVTLRDIQRLANFSIE